MLPEFKKRIDTLRQILVGAVPSPAGQIEQITYALIYKFMNDIDDSATSLPGGKRTYFAGEYKKYSWNELMAPTLGAHDRLTLYRDALNNLAKNPGLPELFQGIYQNAYLTFNDPRVLTLFLKEIDNFKHSSSDDIGDAYEYLLQITGAQGDVGQFRTPRHIIKFIVEAVNPTKDDSVLDPAVGTAGFLIAAYNHVKHHHDGVDDITGLQNDREQRLSSDELDKLHRNYRGFDIDPTMVRTAKVNMYLHGFKTPDIKNHDSLSNTDWWDKRYDVILANPPFMSPKGGMKPHGKFGIVANRSEVLFVDYIASHLRSTGRAGIIVPEGVIFQSGKAYKELRKNLVDNYLYAVVSLPAGVFQPYSGVKTSILLLDRKLAKQRDEVLFVKVENDGFSLGSQRREAVGGQFPEALELIKKFQSGEEIDSGLVHIASRELIAKSGDYNLSGDRYAVTMAYERGVYPIVQIQDVADVRKGSSITKECVNTSGRVPVVAGGQQPAYYHDKSNRDPDTITISASGAYAGFVNYWTVPIFASDCSTVKSKDENIVLVRFLYYILKSLQDDIYKLQTGGGQPHIYSKDIQNLKFPLPPINIQQEIITELDGYHKIIDAAQIIIKTYKPNIKINQKWELATIGSQIRIERGASPRPIDKFMTVSDSGENWVMIGDTKNAIKYITTTAKKVTPEGAAKSRLVLPGDFILSNSMSFGKPYIMKTRGFIHDGWLVLRVSEQQRIDQDFLYYILGSEYVQNQFEKAATGGVVRNLNSELVRNTNIPLPSIDEQKQIVAQLESEQALVDANKMLLELHTQKIKAKIAEIWEA